MNELIDRQAAIDVGSDLIIPVDGYHMYNQAINNYCAELTNLPAAESQWIPCSERLPKNKSYVLTTIYIPGRVPHSRSGWFEDGLFINDNGDTWNSTDKEVIAWMPLPEPCRIEG